MAREPGNEDLWSKALKELNTSGLDRSRKNEYPPINSDDISKIEKTDPLKADLLRLANQQLEDARAQAEGEKSREKRYHEAGWELAIETPKGIVGLWSGWLKNQYYLGYPKNVLSPTRPETDKLIANVLGVKKVEVDKEVAIPKQGAWTRFYGPLEATGGRVWIDSSDDHSNGFSFKYIKGDKLERANYGHTRSNGIFTYQFSEHNKSQPDGPTDNPEAIQKYRDRFIRLAAEVVFACGGPKGINMNYGFDDKGITLVPEDLYKEGYENITWLKGDLGERKGNGNEVVRGKKGNSTVILESGNSLVPWSTVLHASVNRLNNPKMLAEFVDDLLWF